MVFIAKVPFALYSAGYRLPKPCVLLRAIQRDLGYSRAPFARSERDAEREV